MNVAFCEMQVEDAPPGYWKWPADRAALVDGVEVESSVPTRFFQSLDKYPREWGRLSWRVQLNKVFAGKAGSPFFRTFYPGVEWNLNYPDYRWFLSAWMRWNGPGPPPDDDSGPRVRIEGDTALFLIGTSGEETLYLRSRIDARERKRIAESVRTQSERPKRSSPIIVLDDIVSE
ncbi:MAG: hypothetical protein JO359_10630 [Candidatus Eremiobacteraeota bacterium]|nr:hypothetical protein [Candidatus Eremiobacteraeota bacterium]